ncbi:hypothetical protein CPB84DRAFT_1815732 [Gymnopilus junonius]|uniref:Uncharacterized protein n=1 Tax=Gymnopilus junonius TaxID=109634 RepID=A0A9P5TMC4_GYMJU|nr:hypothetical protein CPB84DRAFT_1815732 [Gymnopilus junonius]
MLSLEELALLPLCGLPAYRAVRTFMYAFSSSSMRDGSMPMTPSPSADRRGFEISSPPTRKGSLSRGTSDHAQGYRRRVLVLRGHDGAGAMAVQMLVGRGWRVSVHVPFSSVPAYATQEAGDRFMHVVEERARDWGADEVIFDDGEEGGGPDDGRGAAVRVLDTLREDGDVFDAVLDTIGGKEVREAAERLLKSAGADGSASARLKRRGVGQFTTLVGDHPERTIPSAGDNFRAGLRSLRPVGGSTTRVGYAWVSVAQDVDWEGDDVGETLRMVLRLALEDGVRPLVEDLVSGDGPDTPRTTPFERAPSVDGGTVVVKIAQ